MDAGRWLVYRFFGLPHQQQLALVRALGLLDPAERGATETPTATAAELERFRRCFRRAREKRLLGRLWSEVEALHADGDTENNPFSGM